MKQTANRALMDRLVERYQTVMSSDDIKAVWTARALPYTISGFNVFIKFGMLSSISCPASGDTITPVTITYTTGVPAADAAIYAYDGSAWEDITPAGGLEAGADQTFDHTFDTANTYTLYVADTVPLVDGDSAPKAYQAINPYERDEATGTASLAEIVISGA